MSPLQTIDEREFDALVEKYFSALTFFARRWVPHAAEDVAQTTFLKLVKYVSKNGFPVNVSAWLFKTAKRTAIDEYRKAVRFQRLRQEFGDRGEILFEESPENKVFAQEMTERLNTLSNDDRQIVLMRVWGGLSFEEIAEIVEESTSGVFRRYQRALETLRADATN
ncbi:MAG: sigma-70 family RNA polymerase sigma factor [Thermoguttaceae bacterium]|nr:sigma-70 family RNA polymerase sigma factor [Thermoguttaceae bacterium]